MTTRVKQQTTFQEWNSLPLYSSSTRTWILGTGAVGTWFANQKLNSRDVAEGGGGIHLSELTRSRLIQLLHSSDAQEIPNSQDSVLYSLQNPALHNPALQNPIEIWVTYKAWQLSNCLPILSEFLSFLYQQYSSQKIQTTAQQNRFQHQEISITFLQNGLGINNLVRRKIGEQLRQNIGEQNNEQSLDVKIYRGVLWAGFIKKSATESELIGSFNLQRVPLTHLLPHKVSDSVPNAETYTDHSFEADAFEADELEWKKALVNLVINPIGMLYEIPNGEILNSFDPTQLAQTLTREALFTAHTQGHLKDIDEANAWNLVKETCQKTAKNRNSLLQDYEKKMPISCTEWEFLTPNLLKIAEKFNPKTYFADCRTSIQLAQQVEQKWKSLN